MDGSPNIHREHFRLHAKHTITRIATAHINSM
jgi:hypothetical protein